ncbi:PREDICTED: zinc finger protein 585A [Drosophila arizonae]|uniref:Zinc finger protein 585A n=1 Tax=Drosophila arizonae TaxID=7263 RepID=A0ABM1PBN6_DROAR|nr:PREDICTED: zinc finger protein 585A [Drosophila arizonae]
METCGVIISRVGEFENFLMRCSYCTIDIEIEKWQEFVLHFRNTHGTKSTDNSEYLHIENLAVNEDSAEEKLVSISTEEQPVEETNVSRPCSTLSDASFSENSSTKSESTASTEDEDVDMSSSNPSTDKFKPSFFRRDPRTLKFIEAYKSQPCLWNPGCSKYKDHIACKAAYQQLIMELDAQISVVFTEHSLKAAIKKLHIQYNMVEKRVMNGNQKPNSVAFNHYTSCSFLKASQDQMHALKSSVIQLNFCKRNKLTTDFIQLYANFPQLYDCKHKDFSSISSRKQAYEAIAAKIIVPHGGINCDDVYLAIQCLRQWYYKSTKHAIKTTNESELSYLKACAFLPPKMFKQKLICEYCQQETSSDHVLQAHLWKVHNIGELPFKCTSCDRSFVGRAELSTHVQRFHIGKTYKCNYCERTFAVNSDLRLHIRTHTGNNILCELCGKAFRLRSQLKLHVTAIHTKIRAFKCTMCPKDFLKKVDLSDHIKSHLNIRDKICTTCGKGFTSCHSLIRHRQIHSEIKKFVCKLCEARFSQFVGLNSHMKRTHNIVRCKAQKLAETLPPETTS